MSVWQSLILYQACAMSGVDIHDLSQGGVGVETEALTSHKGGYVMTEALTSHKGGYVMTEALALRKERGVSVDFKSPSSEGKG